MNNKSTWKRLTGMTVLLYIIGSLFYLTTASAAISDKAENHGFTAVFHSNQTISVEGTAESHANDKIELQFDNHESLPFEQIIEEVTVDARGYFTYTTVPMVSDRVSVFVNTNQNISYYLGVRAPHTLVQESPGDSREQLTAGDPRLTAKVGDAGIAEIRAKWKQYAPVSTYAGGMFLQEPQTSSPYRAGKLQEPVLTDALNMTRFVRYLGGVSETVQLDPLLNESAQHKTVVLEQTYNPRDPHKPAKPANMEEAFYQIAERWKNSGGRGFENLHYGLKPSEAVLSFMDDRGSQNRYNVGHRKAILQFGIEKVGFGYTNNYMLMHLNSTQHAPWPDGRDYVAWPAPGNFPTLLSDFEMFSIHLNPSRYAPIDQEHLRIEVIDKSNAVKWLFYDTAKYQSTGLMYVSNEYNAGNRSDFLTFGHTQLNIKHGDEFSVRITGLQDRQGQDTSIAYEIRFFELDEQKQFEEQKRQEELKKQEEERRAEEEKERNEQGTLQEVPAFRDIAGHWAAEAIKWAVAEGLARGYEDHTFRPNRTVSEAEFLGFFYRPRMELAEENSVRNGHWADELYDLATLRRAPVQGTEDYKLRSAAITRTRVAEIIAAADGKDYSGDAAIAYLLEQGYSKGKTGNSIAGYAGNDLLTRAEALTFSYVLRDAITEIRTRGE